MKLLTHSQARQIAESLWGPGGTVAYHTNRRGAFYFSCSGHGGYIIDDRTLTSDERAALLHAGFTPDACWGVRNKAGDILKVRHPHSEVRHRSITYWPGSGEYQDNNIPVWVFEEDCDWAAVQVHTSIRSGGFSIPDEELTKMAEDSLARWHPQTA